MRHSRHPSTSKRFSTHATIVRTLRGYNICIYFVGLWVIALFREWADRRDTGGESKYSTKPFRKEALEGALWVEEKAEGKEKEEEKKEKKRGLNAWWFGYRFKKIDLRCLCCKVQTLCFLCTNSMRVRKGMSLMATEVALFCLCVGELWFWGNRVHSAPPHEPLGVCDTGQYLVLGSKK